MKKNELNILFQEEAQYREEIAKERCGHYHGRFQAMAKKEGAINAAIRLISKKNPSEGLMRLFDCESKFKNAHNLSCPGQNLTLQ